MMLYENDKECRGLYSSLSKKFVNENNLPSHPYKSLNYNYNNYNNYKYKD